MSTNDQETTDTADLTIPRLTVLTGHTDPESAYVVDDYPYGRLRCQIRYWIDTKAKGKAKGNQRFARQTTNPRLPGTVWNKPHYSTYSSFAFLYLDDIGHVQYFSIPLYWLDEQCNTRVRHSGVYGAMTDEQRKYYDLMLALTRKANPTSTTEWTERVKVIADHISETGEYPVLVNNIWRRENGQLCYLSDPAAYIVAARDLIAARMEPARNADGKPYVCAKCIEPVRLDTASGEHVHLNGQELCPVIGGRAAVTDIYRLAEGKRP